MEPAKQTGWEGLSDYTLETERLKCWGDAYAAWLRGLQAHYSQNVWEDADHAWKEFIAYILKPPWEVKPEDVERYKTWVIQRGLSASTIRIRLMNLRRFYDFCTQSGVDEELVGRENPFNQVEWPKIYSYEKPTYLQPTDERKLLRTIKRDRSAIGRRDYALFLMLVSTGRPAGDVRTLQWRDLVFEGEQVWIAGKGANDRQALPEAVWKAIEHWLTISGRFETVKAKDFIFTPSREALVREAGSEAEDWIKDRPLSMDEVHYLLKLYAGWAGLNAEEVTCHTLRNTAALRKLENGESTQSIQASMGRNDAAETRKYLKKLTQNGVPVGHSRKQLIRKNEDLPSRKPGRAQPGNRLNLRHGYYAKSLPEMEAFERAGIRLEGTERLILMNRFVILRTLIISRDAKSIEQMAILLNIAGKAAGRVAKLIYKKS